MGKYLDLAGLTAYDKKVKEWFKAGIVDITDELIRALFGISTEGPADNEIWYTSSNNSVVEPHDTTVFGASITDNSYEDKGVITFDGNVTSIGNEAFYECTELTSVAIPRKVTSIGNDAFYGCSALGSIEYEGTKEQWNTVTKGEDWNYNVPATDVQCTVDQDPSVETPAPYVTFTAEEDNSSIGLAALSTNQTLEYSTDTTTWNTFDTTTNISLNNGDKVYVRGILSADNISYNYTQFKMSGKIAASGNCNAIWNYQDLNAPLKAYCGYWMFQDCSSLTTAPELPATILAENCYYAMFQNCASLTTAPELPATELTTSCYCYMFCNCASLTTAPDILPATTLAESCYNSMFQNCTSLITAPVLPATTLAVDWCYGYMFMGCTSLNHITCLAQSMSGMGCTSDWVDGVSSTGIFVKHSNMKNWFAGGSGIPSGWTIENAVL